MSYELGIIISIGILSFILGRLYGKTNDLSKKFSNKVKEHK